MSATSSELCTEDGCLHLQVFKATPSPYTGGVEVIYEEGGFCEPIDPERHPTFHVQDSEKVVWFNKDGKLDRADSPAVVWTNGTKVWYCEGKFHRLDGPAIITAEGSQEWWVDGRLMETCAHQPDIPQIMGQHFYHLCVNSNSKIREKAIANPNCPPEWKVAYKLYTNERIM